MQQKPQTLKKQFQVVSDEENFHCFNDVIVECMPELSYDMIQLQVEDLFREGVILPRQRIFTPYSQEFNLISTSVDMDGLRKLVLALYEDGEKLRAIFLTYDFDLESLHSPQDYETALLDHNNYSIAWLKTDHIQENLREHPTQEFLKQLATDGYGLDPKLVTRLQDEAEALKKYDDTSIYLDVSEDFRLLHSPILKCTGTLIESTSNDRLFRHYRLNVEWRVSVKEQIRISDKQKKKFLTT